MSPTAPFSNGSASGAERQALSAVSVALAALTKLLGIMSEDESAC